MINPFDLFAFFKNQGVESFVEQREGEWKLVQEQKLDEEQKKAVIKSFARFLDRVESLGKKEEGRRFIAVAEQIAAKAQEWQTESPEASSLRRRVVALRARFNDPQEAKEAPSLEACFGAWKGEQPNFVALGKAAVTEGERALLQQVSARYPEFVQLLLGDSAFQKDFFTWTMRDGNDPSVFIEYPAVQNLLTLCRLSQRIGKLAQHKLLQNSEKGPTLAIECQGESGGLTKRHVSLLSLIDPDQEQVEIGKKKLKVGKGEQLILRDGYQTTLPKIFEQFQNKNVVEACDVELLAPDGKFLGGVTNFRIMDLAPKREAEAKPFEVSQDEWWNAIPAQETVSAETLQERYGITSEALNGDKWVVFAKATSGGAKINIEHTHGYFGVAIPTPDNRYRLLDFGRFPAKTPTGATMALFLSNTVNAKIAWDDNGYYAYRLQASVPFVITQKQGLAVMGALASKIRSAQEQNHIFQFAGQNCASLPVQLLSESGILTLEEAKKLYSGYFFEEVDGARPAINRLRLAVHYISPVLRDEWAPEHPIPYALFWLVQKITYLWRAVVLNIVMLFLPVPIVGSHLRFRMVPNEKKMVPCKVKSVFLTSFIWGGGRVYLPGKLIKNTREGQFDALMQKKNGAGVHPYLSYGHRLTERSSSVV